MRDWASELRAIAEGRLMLNVRNGVTVARSMLARIADEIDAERAAHAETRRERDEAIKALEQIAAIEPVSNCDAGSMARSRMRDIARYSIARRPK